MKMNMGKRGVNENIEMEDVDITGEDFTSVLEFIADPQADQPESMIEAFLQMRSNEDNIAFDEDINVYDQPGSLLMPDYETTLNIIEKADNGNHISLNEYIEDHQAEDSPEGTVARAINKASTIGHNSVFCLDIDNEVWNSYYECFDDSQKENQDFSPYTIYQLSILHIVNTEPFVTVGSGPVTWSKLQLYSILGAKTYKNFEGESTSIRLIGWKERCMMDPKQGDPIRWGYIEFSLARRNSKWLIQSVQDSNRLVL
jgi:hypothetical protein